jgi:hypothetical protein
MRVFTAWQPSVLLNVRIDQVGDRLSVLLDLHLESSIDFDYIQTFHDLLDEFAS